MSRCTGMWKVRVSAGGAVKDVEIISSSKEQTVSGYRYSGQRNAH